MVGDYLDHGSGGAACLRIEGRRRVVFLGKVKNPIEPLLISDLLVLPSETESFGGGPGSLRRRDPSDFDRMWEGCLVNLHGRTGMLRPVGDVEGMAEDALHVLDSANFPQFQEAALDRAEAFHIHKILPQYEALYRRALANHRS